MVGLEYFQGVPANQLALVCGVNIALWQVIPVLRYSKIFPVTVPQASENSEGCARLSLLVTNLDMRNEFKTEAATQLINLQYDVLILIEINDQWCDEFQELKASFAHRVDRIAEKGLGLSVWSKIPLIETKVEYLVSENRPSIWTQLAISLGDTIQPINLVAVHPTPPGLVRSDGGRFNSSIRDAELTLVARNIADRRDEPWVVSGDFNDVAWSPTTRLFERLSGLKDTRVGRSLFNTYHARYPLLRYPIDHVYVSEGFRLVSLDRIRISGSDHFAMSAELEIEQVEGIDPQPEPGDLAEVSKHVTDAGKEL